MNQKVNTVIIGGGQGGLATSFHLKQHNQEHIVLERASQAGNAWRNDRWDFCTFATPNWTFKLPGAEYEGDSPGGYMPRDEIVRYFEQYVERFQLPVQYGVQVSAVEQNGTGSGYRVRTEEGTIEAHSVVVATGLFQNPKIPAFSAELSSRFTQLHSGKYRSPASLPPGAVLVVGSGQSGCQIAEELYQSGRKVYLCVGSAGRAPRRYRGKDIFEWLYLSGFLDRNAEQLPSSLARFAGNVQATGKEGGHTINLHQFVCDGVTLLGHLQDGRDDTIWLAPDLKQSLAKVDRLETEIVKMVDSYIARNGLDAPQEALPVLRDGYDSKEIGELNLSDAGITIIIWAMGYTFDFSMVKLPVFDRDGFPIQNQAATSSPGLYFAGLPWMPTVKTGLLLGVGEHAAAVAEAIAGRRGDVVIRRGT